MGEIIGAYIEITGDCNERCPYCYNEKLVGTGEALSQDVLLDLIDQLHERGIANVALSGGEPFLYDALPQVLSAIQERGMTAVVISNGTCFEERYAQVLLRYQPTLQITFDGWDDESHDGTRGRGNFAKITGGIKSARQRGYLGAVSARLNLGRNSIGHVDKTLSMFEQTFDVDSAPLRDVSGIYAALLHRVDAGSDKYAHFLDPEEYLYYPEIFALFENWNDRHSAKISYEFNNPDIGCAYNANVENVQCGLRIALNGNVFPCQSFTDDIFCLGNVCENSLDEIMRGKKLSRFIDDVHSRRNSIEECKECGYSAVCAGGCPAAAYAEKGTIYAVTSKCGTRKSGLNDNLLRILRDAQKKRREKTEVAAI